MELGQTVSRPRHGRGCTRVTVVGFSITVLVGLLVASLYVWGLHQAQPSLRPSPAKKAETYAEHRASLVALSRSARFDSDVGVLSAAEVAANVTLFRMRAEFLGAAAGEDYPLAQPFASVKQRIATSRLMEAIGAMPKGALLHLHLDSSVPLPWLVANATYRDHCYIATAGLSIPGWPSRSAKLLASRSVYARHPPLCL